MIDTQTDRHTDAGNDNTQRPKLAQSKKQFHLSQLIRILLWILQMHTANWYFTLDTSNAKIKTSLTHCSCIFLALSYWYALAQINSMPCADTVLTTQLNAFSSDFLLHDDFEMSDKICKNSWDFKSYISVMNTWLLRKIFPTLHASTHSLLHLAAADQCLMTQIEPLALCNIEYPSETHLKLKSHVIVFDHNIRFSCPTVLKFCTEHSSDTAVLCAKFQNDWIPNK